jgi:hypothetical protein
VSVATIVRRTGSGVRDVQPPPLLAVARGSAVRLLAVSPLRAEVSLQRDPSAGFGDDCHLGQPAAETAIAAATRAASSSFRP